MDSNQLTIFPIQNPDIWNFYKKALSAFWVAEEISLYEDMNHWIKLKESEKTFIKYVLAFFSSSDGIVNMNLAQRFSLEIPYKEAVFFYQFQIAMENIHNETYSLLIDTYIKDENEKHRLFDALGNFDCIKKKGEWAFKWINDKESDLSKRVIAFAIVEGIFFSSSFASIFWLKERALMKGLTFSNELISRDEGLHTEFAVFIYLKMVQDNYFKRLDESIVYKMCLDAVEIEEEFITEAIQCEMIGMNSKMMIEYIHFVADRLLISLGYDKIWNASNPFYFMENISLQGKTNFFERKNSDYMINTDRVDELNNDEDF